LMLLARSTLDAPPLAQHLDLLRDLAGLVGHRCAEFVR